MNMDMGKIQCRKRIAAQRAAHRELVRRDLQQLLRRLPAVARLRAGGAHADLRPLLSAQVLDGQLLCAAVPGEAAALRHAAALYAVMKSSTLTTIGDVAFRNCSSLA